MLRLRRRRKPLPVSSTVRNSIAVASRCSRTLRRQRRYCRFFRQPGCPHRCAVSPASRRVVPLLPSLRQPRSPRRRRLLRQPCRLCGCRHSCCRPHRRLPFPPHPPPAVRPRPRHQPPCLRRCCRPHLQGRCLPAAAVRTPPHTVVPRSPPTTPSSFAAVVASSSGAVGAAAAAPICFAAPRPVVLCPTCAAIFTPSAHYHYYWCRL